MRSGIREIRRPKGPERGRRAQPGEQGDDRNQTCTASSSSPESWDPVWPGQEERRPAPSGPVCPRQVVEEAAWSHIPSRQLNPERTAVMILVHRCPTGCPRSGCGRGAGQAGAGPGTVCCPGLRQRGRRCNGQRHAQEPPKLTMPSPFHL